jgi:hypothetical protein
MQSDLVMLAAARETVPVMARRRSEVLDDRHPGPVPDIRPAGDGLIWHCAVRGQRSAVVLRANPDGEMWASIATPDGAPPPGWF